MGGGTALALAGMALLFGTTGRASGEGNATLSLSPASQNVAGGSGPFNIDIKIGNVQNLGEYEFTLKFDRNVLEYVGISDQGFLSNAGLSQNCSVAFGDSDINRLGLVNYGCSTSGSVEQSGASGSATLATVAFRPKAIGKSDVTFFSVPGTCVTDQSNKNSCVVADSAGNNILVHTQLGDPATTNIDFTDSSAAVAVIDPNASTPTGVPATATHVPVVATPNTQATAQAVLGTSRHLTDPVTNSGPSNGGSVTIDPITGAVITTNGTSGSGGSGTGTNGGSGTGDSAVAGTSTGGGANGGSGSGTSGSGGTNAAGSASGSASGGRAPGSAPVAGFGPDPQPPNPWPARGGGMLALGALAIGGGMMMRRRATQRP